MNQNLTLINENTRAIWRGRVVSAEGVEDYIQYKAWWADTGQRITPENMPLARSLKGEVCKNLQIDNQTRHGALSLFRSLNENLEKRVSERTDLAEKRAKQLQDFNTIQKLQIPEEM